jgi:hypothetical protein
VLVFSWWGENYGNAKIEPSKTITNAVRALTAGTPCFC